MESGSANPTRLIEDPLEPIVFSTECLSPSKVASTSDNFSIRSHSHAESLENKIEQKVCNLPRMDPKW
jgi:hypothetical protein